MFFREIQLPKFNVYNAIQYRKTLEKQVEEKADLTESEKEQIQNQLKQFTQLEMQITKNNQKVEVPLQFESNSVLQKKNQQNSLFELKGTINHFGQYNGGHYTAFSKDIQNNQWYEYDDQEVRQVQNINQTIKNNSSNVYVAVYEGIQVQYF
ncbi:hypothetical protein PPERSA_08606 [Pseudocohnilembus persalinus]|uniref:USP domain-containing protein n=1 Tax=Pseudocohnilembus persalinus TaxID=266149 RepID=A0A0V0R1J3_PSEPJ|nr:hypothetical protein PPERSA_08606 [Pseudocohnilembus persalinus]|eukprot:KRX08407.1 hypothetical protein PPERSA_08606 [Pseudocohnilembus persalinus]